jgi:hypothetical protein
MVTAALSQSRRATMLKILADMACEVDDCPHDHLSMVTYIHELPVPAAIGTSS